MTRPGSIHLHQTWPFRVTIVDSITGQRTPLIPILGLVVPDMDLPPTCTRIFHLIGPPGRPLPAQFALDVDVDDGVEVGPHGFPLHTAFRVEIVTDGFGRPFYGEPPTLARTLN